MLVKRFESKYCSPELEGDEVCSFCGGALDKGVVYERGVEVLTGRFCSYDCVFMEVLRERTKQSRVD